MQRTLIVMSALLLLGACNPTAADVEAALTARGFSPRESACVARELDGRLNERDWNTIAEVAGDTMRTSDEWRDMTIGEIGDKLQRIGDARLVSTLLRAGVGCALLGDDHRRRSATL